MTSTMSEDRSEPALDGSVPRTPGAEVDAGHDATAAPDRGPGRYLRILTGVNEQMLSWVPTERARYTALGGVVLGTAVLAAFSMWNAIAAVFGQYSAWFAVPAVAWGLFVLNLDRWLVASSTGSQWRRRAAVLVPRLIIAVFLGIIVAEPLVLKIFSTAIEQHIKDGRQAQLEQLRSGLIACNPLPVDKLDPDLDPPASCQGFSLTGFVAPSTVGDQLTAAKSDAALLRKQITTESNELKRLNSLTQNECAGAKGQGLSGNEGEGPRCSRDQGIAEDYARQHDIAGENAQLTAKLDAISQLESQQRSTGESAEIQRATLIGQRVADMAGHQGAIGFLERLQALNELTDRNPPLFTATWLIRIFFILIDCLPVLVKFITGATAYDRLVDHRISSTDRTYQMATRVAETSITEELAVQDAQARAGADMKKLDIELEVRKHSARIEAEAEAAVQALAEKLLPPRQRRRQAASGARSSPEPPRTMPLNGSSHPAEPAAFSD